MIEGIDLPVHLTFDDGPDPRWTPRVLSTLRAARARATFFVLGEQVRAHPELVGRVLAGGHRVELHGHAHLDHAAVSEEELALDTRAAVAALNELGVRPAWWRLPWGRPGPATAGLTEAFGLLVAGWDADTHDWRGDGWWDQPASLLETARDGGVVLLHDGLGPGTTRRSAENTLDLVTRISVAAVAHGRALEPLPDPDAPAARRITSLGGRAATGAAHTLPAFGMRRRVYTHATVDDSIDDPDSVPS